MNEQIPERIDRFLQLLAHWTIEQYHIRGLPMDFDESPSFELNDTTEGNFDPCAPMTSNP